jgi:hypothetical protein
MEREILNVLAIDILKANPILLTDILLQAD